MSAAATPTRERLLAIVAGFRGRRVVVLGDLVCDEFVHGDIARISREAPVLILEETRTDVVPGGAGNAVLNLRALGAVPLPVGIVGRDPAGERLLRAFRRGGVDVGGIRPEPGYDTPSKSRILAGGVHTRRQQIVRIDRGARHGALPRISADRIVSRLTRALRDASGLLVSDYGYGAATPAMVRAVRSSLGGRPVTVDSRGRIASYRGVSACTPNQEEVETALGTGSLGTTSAAARAAGLLLARTGNAAVLVTRGAAGMLLLERKGRPVAIPAFGSREVADVTGAGDTVIATFTLARISGASFREAAILANVAAGLVVMKVGTAAVTPAELSRALREGPEA